jgi:NAD+-dependent protein deacetylase sirtuin 4
MNLMLSLNLNLRSVVSINYRGILPTNPSSFYTTIRSNSSEMVEPFPIPQGEGVSDEMICHIADLMIRCHGQVAVLTGAGISTESNIPDYRSPFGAYSRGHRPITFFEFVHNEKRRKKFWARGLYGVRSIISATPNPAHLTLAQLQTDGYIDWIVTQNVDCLHQRAGNNSSKILELHGSIADVYCIGSPCKVSFESGTSVGCGWEGSRLDWHRNIEHLNIHLVQKLIEMERNVSHIGLQRPDGDTQLPEDENLLQSFVIPPCPQCGGIVKPKIVFFGENMPREIAELSLHIAQTCNFLLVLGTSLSVQSSFRIVSMVHNRRIPILLCNIGETCGDSLANFLVSEKLTSFLLKLSQTIDSYK